jgi:S-adenosylhomocysteine hydrolase
MEAKVHGVPEKIDMDVARYALEAMDVRIDEITEEQRRYQQSS